MGVAVVIRRDSSAVRADDMATSGQRPWIIRDGEVPYIRWRTRKTTAGVFPMYIPPGFGTVTPYFFVADAERFVAFLVDGLGGEEILRSLRPDGRIANAQVVLGTSTVMVSESSPKYPPMPASYYLYVEDADAAMSRALAHGATLEMEAADMPYGDRQGGIKDTHGNIWWVSQRMVREPYAA